MKRSKQDSGSSDVEDTSRRANRRQALALGGAAAAAAAVAALGVNGGKKAQAATGDSMILGQDNTADQPTVLQADQLIGASLYVENRGGGNRIAIEGISDGDSPDQPAGVVGRNEAAGPDAAPGVFGESQNGWGVFGSTRSGDRAGVGGVADAPEGFPLPFGPGTGVHGTSGSGLGVFGFSITGNGVEGQHLSNTEPASAVHGLNMGAGPGVEGSSRVDPSVPGSGSGPGVHGISDSGFGVEGQSTDGWGLLGESKNFGGIVGVTHAVPAPGIPAVGVLGVSDTDKPGGAGVAGTSDGGTGVSGESQSGPGVLGRAPGDAPGVRALSDQTFGPPTPAGDGGLALDVVGKAAFSTAGAGVVPAGSKAASVEQLSVTDQSHVMVMLMGDPGNAAAVVQWVERQPASGFIVHLRVAVSNETPFTYLIVEPGA